MAAHVSIREIWMMVLLHKYTDKDMIRILTSMEILQAVYGKQIKKLTDVARFQPQTEYFPRTLLHCAVPRFNLLRLLELLFVNL